ncbi:tetratricopeptide repeat protein [Actinomadura barringtoniae]|uniref:Tetratricopeptide repeat protein n=1 Tax=Actinomadura barringtoniae TaxID=1427535 RepID=A0A939P8W8_9ACTN|nr:tetratricopeptide repeat protein [Actinomadura barringtoniae]MBO2447960.1 tetratricopeptide repeat protein [Actinomadura barringtoniae]
MSDENWQRRVDDLWDVFDRHEPADFLKKMEALVSERPEGDPLAAFELASANDSIGTEGQAEPLYRVALAGGLPAAKRRRATIQLASTVRNLGQIEESIALLSAEREAGSDELDDAVDAFLALALADAGREREGLSLALGALSRHLPRYNRSLANYARMLNDEDDA